MKRPLPAIIHPFVAASLLAIVRPLDASPRTPSATGPVALINEVRANDAGSDDVEFIEIVAQSGQNLQGFYLIHYNGDPASDTDLFKFTFPSFVVPDDGIADTNGTTLGFAVIAQTTTGVANADFKLPTTMQNGPDGLVLYDATGKILDAVAWGGEGDLTVDDPGTVTRSGNTYAPNFLHVTVAEPDDDRSLQAPDNVCGDDGSGWALTNATPGAINIGQTSGHLILQSRLPPSLGLDPAGTNRLAAVSNRVFFAVIATEPDREAIHLSATNLPPGAAFADKVGLSALTNAFDWIPTATGLYSIVFTASDTDGTNVLAVTIHVSRQRVIVISEIMMHPAASPYTKGEWFELYNPGNTAVDINGWTIEDNGSEHHTISVSGSLLVPAKGFRVLGISTNRAENGGAPVDYRYTGINLTDTSDAIVLLDASQLEIERVEYGSGWPRPTGASIYLKGPDLDPNQGANWSASTQPWPGSAGDKGSPGAANEGTGWQGILSNVAPSLAVSPPGFQKAIMVGQPLSFSVTASEPSLDQGDPITLWAEGLPAGAEFPATQGYSPVSNAFTWTPASEGTYPVTFRASDKDGTNAAVVTITAVGLRPGGVWINEFHYDNVGNDTNEGVEVAGRAGISLSGYRLVFYNGANGKRYREVGLSGRIDNEGSGFGAVWFGVPANGIENGPDGIALIRVAAGGTNVLQFLSYEGQFVAVDGPAAGIRSTDVLVVEHPDNGTPVGQSLQLIGKGTFYSDFHWTGPASESRGRLNDGQTLVSEATVMGLF